MQNSKRQISEKQRRSSLFTYIFFITLTFVYVGMRVGYFYATRTDATLVTAIIDFMSKCGDKPWQIYPTKGLPIGLFLFPAAIVNVIMYNKYLVTKDTVEYAHGDARFETNYDEYEREFVVDPAIVSEMTGIKMYTRERIVNTGKSDMKLAKSNQISVKKENCPRNDEGKKIYAGITQTQGDKVKYHDVIEECRRRAMVYTDTVYLSLNGSWSQRNINAIIFGAAGTGKSRYFLKPNILQANSSIVCTDPSGDVMQATGYFLEKIMNYDVRCFNIEDMTKSCRFNPLYYIRDTKDIAIVVNTFLENINGEKKSSGGDGDFWTQAAKALMCGVIGYLYEVCPMEQRNFSNVLDVIRMDSRSENDDSTVDTDFDMLFKSLGEASPASYAYQQYCIFKQAPAKTRLNILISTSVNLSQMDIPEVKNLTYKDEMDLNMVGEKKMAIFLIIPQADTTYTWLTAMFYSLLFKRLYSYGENRMKQSAIDAANGVIDPETGKVVKSLSDPQMKIPVRFLIDECRNIGKIPNLSIYLATCRKYRISIVPIFQNYSQIEELYGKEGANSIVSNCDAFLFLGGSDESTLKIIQGHLGKETVKTLSNSMAQSAKGSNSASKQQTGKDLMTRDQIETMSNAECLLFIRALRPFKTKKYDLVRHPNYKYLDEGLVGKAFSNPYDAAYEDEEIEGNRVRTAREDGYIAPKIVESARRRTLVSSNINREQVVNDRISYLMKQLQSTSDENEIESINAEISSLKIEIMKLTANGSEKNPLLESDETKTNEQYKNGADGSGEIQTDASLENVINSETVGSAAFTNEFDEADNDALDKVLHRNDVDAVENSLDEEAGMLESSSSVQEDIEDNEDEFSEEHGGLSDEHEDLSDPSVDDVNDYSDCVEEEAYEEEAAVSTNPVDDMIYANNNDSDNHKPNNEAPADVVEDLINGSSTQN